MANASVEWQLCEDINENTAITNVSVDDGEMILVNLKDKHDGNLRYEALKVSSVHRQLFTHTKEFFFLVSKKASYMI
jgi:hypothetical protein